MELKLPWCTELNLAGLLYLSCFQIMPTFQMYGDETCVCYDIQILSVYMELIYKNNCNVRISGTGKKNQNQPNSWYLSGYCKLQFWGVYWITGIIHRCFKDVGVILSVECIKSLKGKWPGIFLGDRVLSKCRQFTNILSQIWKQKKKIYLCLHGNLYCTTVWFFCSSPEIEW